MARSEDQTRAALEAFFPRPFTDQQWEMLVALGYEQAIISGERTAEQVAAELADIISAVTVAERGLGEPGEGVQIRDPRTWDEMEKWVLGRALAGAGGGRQRSVIGHGVPGAPVPVAPQVPWRRRWWFWAAIGVVAVIVIVALVYVGVARDKPAPTTSTSLPPATTTTEQPTTTTSSSTTTSTTVASTTTTVDLTPTFTARLTGDQAVPPVQTDATGTLSITLAEDGQSVDYVFEVADLSDLTLARLKTAAPGENGDEILFLYPGPGIPGAFTGVVAEGTITADQLLGPLAGKTIADFMALVETGTVYLNVGTAGNRNGEIRGHLALD